jgi:hypothetical protein
MDAMVLEPRDLQAIERSTQPTNPWSERHRIGAVRGWLAGVGAALTAPTRMMRAGSGPRGPRDAVLFLVVTAVVFSITGFAPVLVAIGWAGFAMGYAGEGLAIAAALLALLLLALTAGALLWAVSVHGALRLTGATKGFGTTVEAVSYASAANVLSAVPCLAVWFGWVGWVWWAVSCSLMLIEGHRVAAWRAIVAVFLVPAVLTLGSLALIGVEWHIQSQLMPVTTSVKILPDDEATLQIVGDDLRAWAGRRNGLGPPHAASLMVDTGLSLGTLVVSSGASDLDRFPVVGFSPGQWRGLSQAEQRRAIADFMRRWPADVVAHRLGDVVFTYHGVLLDQPQSPLWVAIGWPDPAQNPQWGPGEAVAVLYADGRLDSIAFERFTAALAAQNQLRAAEGLPPLPEPSTVDAAAPARAP